MSNLRQRIKQVTPKPLWRATRDLLLAPVHLAAWSSATFHPLRRKSITQLAGLKDSHLGQRVFILGNGPSLAKTDISPLAGEITFGLNRVYLAYQDWGFENSYFVSVNDLVIEQSAADIVALRMPKFLSWRSRKFMPDDNASNIFLNTSYDRPNFAKDARGRLWEGATVTYIALQLAFFMGFDTVILIGVDHSFSTRGEPNTSVISKGDDPDHFDKKYFGQGFRWQLPDLAMSEKAYKMAKTVFETHGRKVLDATLDGKLTVFPKVEYESLF